MFSVDDMEKQIIIRYKTSKSTFVCASTNHFENLDKLEGFVSDYKKGCRESTRND